MRRRIGPHLTGTTLAGIVLLAAVVRVGYILAANGEAVSPWIDPDGYLRQGRLLARGGWHWTIDAVRYREYFLAPIHPVFLSLFVSFPSYPLAVALAQSILSTLTVLLVYDLGRTLHSSRAGLIAAAGYAIFFPAVIMLVAFRQEHLYIPLLVAAAALLARAVVTSAAPWRFGLAGVALGFAALARSIPVHFVAPTALLWLFIAPDRKRARFQSLAFVIGFSFVAVPYVVHLWFETQQVVLIESIGSFMIATSDPDILAAVRSSGVPLSFPDTLGVIWDRFATAPLDFLTRKIQLIAAQATMGGGRWLQWHGSFANAATATATKLMVHLFSDFLLVSCLVLAPIGYALAARKPAATLIVLWLALQVILTAMADYAGQRLREPLDPFLFVLAACVLAGGWQRPPAAARAVALITAGLIAVTALGTVPRSLAAHADYGLAQWSRSGQGRRNVAGGEAGFNLRPIGGFIDFRLSPVDSSDPFPIEHVRVVVNGMAVQDVAIERDGLRLRYPSRSGLAYVEVQTQPGHVRTWVLQVEVDDHLPNVNR